jgi:ABC-type sulfate transport system substrate-binding protein
MTRRRLHRLLQAGLTLGAFALCFGVISGARAQTELLNVSYDPTRELYREINAAFIADWNGKNAKKISTIRPSRSRWGLDLEDECFFKGR